MFTLKALSIFCLVVISRSEIELWPEATKGEASVVILDALVNYRDDLFNAYPDCYVIASIHHKNGTLVDGKQNQTSTINNSRQPSWKQDLTFRYISPQMKVCFQILDDDQWTWDDSYGSVCTATIAQMQFRGELGFVQKLSFDKSGSWIRISIDYKPYKDQRGFILHEKDYDYFIKFTSRRVKH